MRQSAQTFGLLLEIILSTLFFSIICTVVLQLFYTTRLMTAHSYDQSRALNCAQSVADIYRCEHPFDELMDELYGESFRITDDEQRFLTLDSDMQPCTEAQCAFEVVLSFEDVQVTPAGRLQRLTIFVKKKDALLYELPVEKYETAEVIL
jgi:hypothetical protein